MPDWTKYVATSKCHIQPHLSSTLPAILNDFLNVVESAASFPGLQDYKSEQSHIERVSEHSPTPK